MKPKSKGANSWNHIAYLGLGSNLGDRLEYLAEAVRLLNSLPDSAVQQVSSIYETEPVGFKEQEDFLNLALELRTNLELSTLFEEAKGIEKKVGRIERERWRPREIDIDLLLYNKTVYQNERLSVPHPELTRRRFVLVPLVEIAGDVIHPTEKVSVEVLLKRCDDTSRVVKTGYKHAVT